MLENKKSKITVYADGSCPNNPGLGGWAYCYYHGDNTEDIFYNSGNSHKRQTTCNRMEVMAVIKALENLPEGSTLEIFCDSLYVVDGMTLWMPKWKAGGWKKKKEGDVKNIDLWKVLDALASNFDIKWTWVKGHSGNMFNEFVDLLAGEASRS